MNINADLIEVRKALKVGRSCTIVDVRWLIDCLPHSNAKKRLRSVKEYALNKRTRSLKDGKAGGLKHDSTYDQRVREGKELADHSKSPLFQVEIEKRSTIFKTKY